MPSKNKNKGAPSNGGGYFGPQSTNFRSNGPPPPPSSGFYYSSAPNSRMATPVAAVAAASSIDGRRYEDQMTPTYSVEHLATFGYGAEFGLQNPGDGIRKLKQMELSNAIWAQRMVLRLRQDAVIIEDENGEVVETFPMNLVSEPSAHLSRDARDVYNNLLLFVVNGDKQRSGTPTEMHIFQCVRISANDVAEDVKRFLQGRGSTVQSGRHESGYNSNDHSFQHQQQQSQQNTSTVLQHVDNNGHHRNSLEHEIQSTSMTFERDVNMLNRCFDEIERFVARIQQAAITQRENERKRRGVQQIPPQFPAEQEFYEIFQKFKYCFNLLAKLKNHIHEPNAPELLHFLFTPFTVILDACNWGIQRNVALRVYNPPMTPEAKTLLQNSLTSRESEVWMSLGEAWTVAPAPGVAHRNGSSSVSGSAIYAPEFGPRRTPVDNGELRLSEMEILADRYRRLGVEEERLKREREDVERQKDLMQRKERELKAQEERLETISRITADDRHMPTPPPLQQQSVDNTAYHRTIYTDSMTNGSPLPVGVVHDDRISSDSPRQRAFLEDLKSRRAKAAQITYDRVGQNPKELTVSKGEFVEVLNDTKKWWECKNIHHRVGYVPHTILTVVFDGVDGRTIQRPPPVQGARPTNGQMNGRNNHSPSRPVVDNYRDDGDDNTRIKRMVEHEHNGYHHQRYHSSSYNSEDNVDYEDDQSSDEYPRYGHQNGFSSVEEIARRHFEHHAKQQPVVQVHSAGVQTAVEARRNAGVQSDLDKHRPAPVAANAPPAPAPPPPPAPALPAIKNQITTKQEPAPSLERQNGEDAKDKNRVEALIISRQPMPDMRELTKTIKERDLGAWKRKQPTSPSDPVIGEYSSASDIRDWLLAKGFSPRTISVLEGQSGALVFALGKQQLQQFCGIEEGKRLYSQLLVQKSLTGYSTKRDAELKAILRARQERADESNTSTELNTTNTSAVGNLTSLFQQAWPNGDVQHST